MTLGTYVTLTYNQMRTYVSLTDGEVAFLKRKTVMKTTGMVTLPKKEIPCQALPISIKLI